MFLVYPAGDQDPDTQEYDEYKCYKWAVDRTGIHPGRIASERYESDRPSRPQTGPDGSVIGGAAGGAVIGALIGAISGNAKKGAKIGALAGGAAGVGSKIAKDNAAKREYEEEKYRAEEDKRYGDMQILKFKKSFCACMDGRGYSTKY